MLDTPSLLDVVDLIISGKDKEVKQILQRLQQNIKVVRKNSI